MSKKGKKAKQSVKKMELPLEYEGLRSGSDVMYSLSVIVPWDESKKAESVGGKVKIDREKTLHVKHKSCWESHPKLPITVGDKTYYVTGGSCTCGGPFKEGDYDVVVGLDWGFKPSEMMYPWKKGEAFLYEIKDMSVPTDKKSFHELIGYLEKSVLAGKSVFVGCIGGHGRTGLVLSALVCKMTGEKKAIEYVRKNYCEKAVETTSQIEFLNKEFGVEKAKGSKVYNTTHGYGGAYGKSAYGKDDDGWFGYKSATTSNVRVNAVCVENKWTITKQPIDKHSNK